VRAVDVQEFGIVLLAKRGVWLLTASGDDLTDSDNLGRKMMRQVASAFAEYEKGPMRSPRKPTSQGAAVTP
jgi:hypothetical protein